MELERVDVHTLHLDPENARLHSEENIRSIAGSLSRFGQQKPIVIDQGNRIIAGNGTYLGALSLGWHQINAIRSALTDKELKAYALADNRTAELATWDKGRLAQSIREIVEAEIDAGEIGFDEDFIASIREQIEESPAPGGDAAASADRLTNQHGTSHTDAIQGFLENNIRYIQLTYIEGLHQEIMGLLDQIAREHGFSNNSDAALWAIRQAVAK